MPTVMLYDADCGFCTRVAHLSPRLGCRAEVVPFQEWPHLAAHGITTEAATEALHVVAGERVLVGHEAVAGVLESSTHAPVRLAGRVVLSRPVAPVASRVYAWVAAHRQQLPGGTAACAIDAPPAVRTTGPAA